MRGIYVSIWVHGRQRGLFLPDPSTDRSIDRRTSFGKTKDIINKLYYPRRRRRRPRLRRTSRELGLSQSVQSLLQNRTKTSCNRFFVSVYLYSYSLHFISVRTVEEQGEEEEGVTEEDIALFALSTQQEARHHHHQSCARSASGSRDLLRVFPAHLHGTAAAAGAVAVDVRQMRILTCHS